MLDPFVIFVISNIGFDSRSMLLWSLLTVFRCKKSSIILWVLVRTVSNEYLQSMSKSKNKTKYIPLYTPFFYINDMCKGAALHEHVSMMFK